MAKIKHPNQEKQRKLHRETGTFEAGVSYSPYRNPPYQYDDVLAETEEKEAETANFADPTDEIATGGTGATATSTTGLNAGTPGDIINRG